MNAGVPDPLTGLIEQELRTGRDESVDAGVDPDEVTVDLIRRIQRLRQLARGTDPAGPA